jgi:hypothetical protein
LISHFGVDVFHLDVFFVCVILGLPMRIWLVLFVV